MFVIPSAFALQVDVSTGNSQWVYYHFDADGDGTWDDPNTVYDTNGRVSYTYDYAYAGSFNLDFRADANSAVYQSTYGFCIDLTVTAGSGTASLEAITTDTLRQAAWILDNFYSSGNTALQNAAIQLAIWDIIYGYAANGTDRFVPWASAADGDVYDLYNDYITALENNYPVNGFDASDYMILDFDGQQDMITTTPVPEPATFALFVLGMLGISAYSRKRS